MYIRMRLAGSFQLMQLTRVDLGHEFLLWMNVGDIYEEKNEQNLTLSYKITERRWGFVKLEPKNPNSEEVYALTYSMQVCE